NDAAAINAAGLPLGDLPIGLVAGSIGAPRAGNSEGDSGWIVGADYSGPPGSEPVGEILEGLNQSFETAVVVEVIGLDVGNDDDLRVVVEKAAIELVRFGHDPVAFPQAAKQIVVDKLRTDVKGGIPSGAIEQVRDQGSGGALAV